MASSYPTSLDSFTDPTSGSSLASPSHSGQHIDLNDAVEKLETKLGIGSSPASSAVNGAVLVANGSGVTTYSTYGHGVYTAFTPTWTNLTIGNGVNDFKAARVNNFVHIHGKMTFGTTTSITATGVSMSLPYNAIAASVEVNGGATFQDTGTNTFWGFCRIASTTTVAFEVYNTGGAYATSNNISPTTPHVWASTDIIYVNFIYEAA